MIHIPVGSESARTLSTIVSLPNPTYDPSSGWKITSSGSDVSLKPASGQVGQIGGGLLITLSGIPVNQTAPDTVPITITETPDSGAPVVDSTTYGLLKETSDFVVTSFSATPSVLYDIHQTVTFNWAVTEAGDKLVYSLHSDSWQPKDCLHAGDCYTAADGRNGVESGPIQSHGLTTFSLDVIETVPGGSRKILDTVTTSVRVEAPQFSGNEQKDPSSPSQRLVALYWWAWGAAHCSVALDGNVIAGAEPLDVYQQGWFWLLDGPVARHEFDVTAYAGVGRAKALWNSGDIAAHDLPVAALGDDSFPSSVALASGGTVALVACADRLAVVDIAGATVEPDPILPLDDVTVVAATPDGALGLITHTDESALLVIDVAARNPTTGIPVGMRPTDVVVSPDGKLAAAASSWDSAVVAVSLVARKAVGAPLKLDTPDGLAFTPDGATLLVASAHGGSVTPVDVKTWTPGTPIAVGGAVSAVAVTPDGRTAVALDPAGGGLYAIDLATRAVAWSLAVGGTPTQLAIMPDNRLVLVTASDANALVAIDLERKAATGARLPTGTAPQAIAAAPDGSVVAVANWQGGSLALI